MAPPVDWRTRTVYKDNQAISATRILGWAVEIYFNLCFSIGGNSVSNGDFPDTVRVRLDTLGYRDLLLCPEQRQAAIKIGADIRERLFAANFCILKANVPVNIAGEKVGEHDLIVELLGQSRQSLITGRFSVEVKIRRIRNEQFLPKLHTTLQEEAWLRIKQADGTFKQSWWQTISHEPHWAGRILVLVQLPGSEADGYTPYKVRAEQRLLHGAWAPLFGWPSSAFAPSPKAVPKAVAKAGPTAVPKALPRARPGWDVFKKTCGPWKEFGGKKVAAIKTFLKKASKPCSNSERKVAYWKESLLKGRITGQHFFLVDRNFFVRDGSRPGGGSKQPAASEEALRLVYATY